jgi:hypothetical protein
MDRGHRTRRVVRRFLAIGVFALLLGAAVGVWLLLPTLIEDRVRKSLERVSQSLGSEVAVEAVETYQARSVVLRGVTIRDSKAEPEEPPVLFLPEVEIEVDRLSVVFSKPRLVSVRVKDPELLVLRRVDGTDNLGELRDKVQRWLDRPKAGGVPGARSVFDEIDSQVPSVEVSGGRLVLRDLTPNRTLIPTFLPNEIALTNGVLSAKNTSAMLDRLDLQVDAKADFDIFRTELHASATYDRHVRRGTLSLRLGRPCTITLPGERTVTIGEAVWSGGRTLTFRDVAAPPVFFVEEVIARWRPNAGLSTNRGLASLLSGLEVLQLKKPVMPLDQLLSAASNDLADRLPDSGNVLPPGGSPQPKEGKRPKLKKKEGKLVRDTVAGLFLWSGGKFRALAKKIRAMSEKIPFDRIVLEDAQLRPGDEQLKFNMEFKRNDLTASLEVSTELANAKPSLKLKVAADTGDIQAAIDVPHASLAALEPYVPHSIVLKDSLLRDTKLKLQYLAEDQSISVRGDLHVAGLTLQLASIASVALDDVRFGGDFRARYSISEATASFSSQNLKIGKVPTTVALTLADVHQAPLAHLEFDVPRVSAQTVLESLPKGLLGRLSEVKTTGDIAWSLKLDLDMRDMNSLEYVSDGHEYELKVTSMGERLDLATLKKPFTHRVQEPNGKIEEFTTGPRSRRWVPLSLVSEWMAKVLTTTEDGSFYRHQGLAFFAIRDALVQNLQRGSFYRGASTLTQQLVKNLFLIREKTVARKLQEMFLAWHMDRHLKKKQILALYVNVVEFGPRIYGIGRAAKYYFGKKPKDLDPVECAFLASMLPNPKKYHYQFRRGEVTEAWRIGLQRTLEVMVKRKKMTKRKFESLAPYSPVFRKRK